MGLTEVGRELGREFLGPVKDLGGYIRAQRTAAHISIRGLAERAGVSNPYLSQVERGLRRPSAAILTQIADGLSISAETLLAKAGIVRPAESKTGVVDAIHADAQLSERHKRTLIDVYHALTAVSDHVDGSDHTAASHHITASDHTGGHLSNSNHRDDDSPHDADHHAHEEEL